MFENRAKKMISKTIILSVGWMLLASSAFAHDHSESEDLLQSVLAGDHRSDKNKARDQYRHPLETLTFFGIEPDMTVVEISPGGGAWYTEVLAPYLKDKGKLYAAGADPESSIEYFQKTAKKFKDKMQSNDVYSNVKVVPFEPPQKIEIAPVGMADRVLTFRNIHNWMSNGTTDDVYAAMYKALKPGGILGVVEHRGNPDTEQDPKAGSGYVNQDVAIAQAEKAGFKLMETSEVNANAKDDKDHPAGVWTLPPRLKLEDQDKDKYLAIGESDRFTLKFIKPAK